ncbi:MAG: hypothetical protein FWD24_07970, partial [Treponema sp.]|nr:hypothetical protein [Treponema sp.]
LGVGHAWSEAGYQVKSKITVNDSEINDDVINVMKQYGITDVSKDGFESILKNNAFNARVFGGLSVNMTAIKLDFTVMYNFSDSYGFTIGTRFQI